MRPLFQWLPILLIFLVAAITMRQWAEERRMGTLEVLLTLPVPTRDMVLGKFVAGAALVALALAMTLPLPIMVSMLGDLDIGPVIGGYVGALLLGATYLSIGLCVSSRTDNQVVALMVTLLVAGALYFIGSNQLTQLFGSRVSEVLQALGTGSRFASIERGVLDLRDLAYYVGLTAFFLSLNWYFLEVERLDRRAAGGQASARGIAALTALVGLNALALSVWLAPVGALRIDLTERGEYSISRITRETLAALDEPLFVHGYFSERTHPLLAPLVPQIRDLLEEYSIAGGDRVRVAFEDPNTDEAIEQEIAERYSIRSVPFRVADRHQQAVVNSYFHVLVKYGDKFETLSFDELIDVHVDDNSMDVRLKNLEYDLTRTIKRVSQDFQTMETLFARIPGEVRLTAYSTPDTLPEDFGEIPERIRTIAAELEEASGGRLVFSEVDPTGDAALQQRLAEDYGIRPLAVDLFGRQSFYLDLVFEAGERTQRIMPRSDLSEGDLRTAIESAVRRATPGQLKTIGLYSETPEAPPPNPNLPPQMQPPPPQQDYRGIQQLFAEDYQVERIDLESGAVPDHVDVLLIGKPGPLSAEAEFAIDQYPHARRQDHRPRGTLRARPGSGRTRRGAARQPPVRDAGSVGRQGGAVARDGSAERALPDPGERAARDVPRAADRAAALPVLPGRPARRLRGGTPRPDRARQRHDPLELPGRARRTRGRGGRAAAPQHDGQLAQYDRLDRTGHGALPRLGLRPRRATPARTCSPSRSPGRSPARSRIALRRSSTGRPKADSSARPSTAPVAR